MQTIWLKPRAQNGFSTDWIEYFVMTWLFLSIYGAINLNSSNSALSTSKSKLSFSHFWFLTKIFSLLRSRSGRSHVTLPFTTRLLQTDIHSFLGNKPINVWLSFSCKCSRLWLVQRIQGQLNERLIGPSKQKRKTPRKECMSVWSSRVGTGSITWLRPERLRRRLQNVKFYVSFYHRSMLIELYLDWYL